MTTYQSKDLIRWVTWYIYTLLNIVCYTSCSATYASLLLYACIYIAMCGSIATQVLHSATPYIFCYVGATPCISIATQVLHHTTMLHRTSFATWVLHHAFLLLRRCYTINMWPDLGKHSVRDPCAICAMSVFSSSGWNFSKSRFCHIHVQQPF